MITSFKKKNFFKQNPVRTVCFSFLIIILLGGFILFLPISSNDGKTTNFLDCIFTATSATCVTGLTTTDTFSHWSDFGKTIILILIQTGGLGLISFSSFFLLVLNNKLSLKNMKLASSQINVNNFADIKSLFKNLLLITFFCELFGTIILCFSYCKHFGSYGVFMAAFSSVAAYCNAGIDLNGMFYENCSFIPFSQDLSVIITISALTFVGGIGFVVINEIINFKKAKIKLRRLSINSKIAILASLFLVVFGTVGFLLLEYDNVLTDMNLKNKISNSFFISTAARTSGFATVDLSKINSFTKVFLSLLMFIGANTTGTAGGIKISTLMIIFATVINVVRNNEENAIFGHKINKPTTYKAIALFFLSLSFVFAAAVVVWFFDSKIGLNNILFTITSAFSTTGFQVANYVRFSVVFKLVLILLMYIGRIGPISFALIFKNKHKNFKQTHLPEAVFYI